MGPVISLKDKIKERNNILDRILDNLRKWDRTIESGVDIIEANEANFNKVRDINLELKKFASLDQGKKEYKRKLKLVLEEQKKFIKSLELERNKLFHNMKQLDKRKDVEKSYIANKRDPVFIDKDL